MTHLTSYDSLHPYDTHYLTSYDTNDTLSVRYYHDIYLMKSIL